VIRPGSVREVEFLGGGYVWISGRLGDSTRLAKMENGRWKILHSYCGLSSHSPFSEGLATVSCLRNEDNIPTSSLLDAIHEAYVDTLGNEILHEQKYRRAMPFCNGYARVFDGKRWFTIDKTGKRLDTSSFYDKNWSHFRGGFAVLPDTTGRVGVVDTAGNFVIQPVYRQIEMVSENPALFACLSGRSWQLGDLNGSIKGNTPFSGFDRQRFSNGLLLVQMDSVSAYINMRGEIVWQGRKWTRDSLDIDYMLEANCMAHSRYWGGGRDTIGKNYPFPIPATLRTAPNGLSLVVTADSTLSRSRQTLFLANRTGDNALLNVQDDVLYIKLQAFTPNGIWNDINYMSPSSCGNSYWSVDLPRNACFSFPVPQFRGSMRTKLPFILMPRESNGRSNWNLDDESATEKLIYSNEFKGSINPGQLWRKVPQMYQSDELLPPFRLVRNPLDL
jgi:hypothetical protein